MQPETCLEKTGKFIKKLYYKYYPPEDPEADEDDLVRVALLQSKYQLNKIILKFKFPI